MMQFIETIKKSPYGSSALILVIIKLVATIFNSFDRAYWLSLNGLDLYFIIAILGLSIIGLFKDKRKAFAIISLSVWFLLEVWDAYSFWRMLDAIVVTNITG